MQACRILTAGLLLFGWLEQSWLSRQGGLQPRHRGLPLVAHVAHVEAMADAEEPADAGGGKPAEAPSPKEGGDNQGLLAKLQEGVGKLAARLSPGKADGEDAAAPEEPQPPALEGGASGGGASAQFLGAVEPGWVGDLKRASTVLAPAGIELMEQDVAEYIGSLSGQMYSALDSQRWEKKFISINTSVVSDGLISMEHFILAVAHRFKPDDTAHGAKQSDRYDKFSMELASALESICYVVKCTTKTRPVTTTYKRMKVSFSKDKLDNLINKYTTMGEEEETGGGQDFEEEGDHEERGADRVASRMAEDLKSWREKKRDSTSESAAKAALQKRLETAQNALTAGTSGNPLGLDEVSPESTRTNKNDKPREPRQTPASLNATAAAAAAQAELIEAQAAKTKADMEAKLAPEKLGLEKQKMEQDVLDRELERDLKRQKMDLEKKEADQRHTTAAQSNQVQLEMLRLMQSLKE